jgi:hypothetical protein
VTFYVVERLSHRGKKGEEHAAVELRGKEEEGHA